MTAMKEVDSESSVVTAVVNNSADSDEAVHLRSENKKLNYRITTLLRTIDEIEGEKNSAQWKELITHSLDKRQTD